MNGLTATIVYHNGTEQVVQYHDTAVVRFDENRIVLNSDNHLTKTTKTRMNQASEVFGLGFCVYQKAKLWFVEYMGKTIEYHDGIIIERQRSEKMAEKSNKRMVTDKFTVVVPITAGTQEERTRIAFRIAAQLSDFDTPVDGPDIPKWSTPKNAFVGERITVHRLRAAADDDDEGEEIFQYDN